MRLCSACALGELRRHVGAPWQVGGSLVEADAEPTVCVAGRATKFWPVPMDFQLFLFNISPALVHLQDGVCLASLCLKIPAIAVGLQLEGARSQMLIVRCACKLGE